MERSETMSRKRRRRIDKEEEEEEGRREGSVAMDAANLGVGVDYMPAAFQDMNL